MFNPVKRAFTVLGALVFVLAFCAPAAGASVTPGSPQVQKAIKGAVNYLEKELQSPGYDGMLEWAMLGYYGIGEDAGHLANIREAQITRGIMLSETKSTDYQRTVLGALAAGKNPDGYGGKNLLQSIISSQTPSGKFADAIDGAGERLINAHVWGIISLHAAGESIPNSEHALQWLTLHQNADGGFSIDTRLADSDVDMTAMSIIAMACLDKDKSFPAVEKSLAYLQEQQNEDGTFGAWGSSSTESCAQVVQALIILGIDPTDEQWSKSGGNPVTGLLQYRLADGSFSHGSERLPNDMASAQALIALGDYSAGESVYKRLGATGKTVFRDVPDGHFAY